MYVFCRSSTVRPSCLASTFLPPFFPDNSFYFKMVFSVRSVFMLFLFSHLLLVQAHPGHVRKRKEFDLTITWEQHAPDGFSRQMLLVNGQSPGPVLEIDQDDEVVVRVHNQSPYSTTIHFHGKALSTTIRSYGGLTDPCLLGIEMFGTPWSDGVPGVTQRAIQPGHTFVHRFKATQHGSYWYHSHYRGQIEDGLYGPIVIHPRPTDPKPFHFISNDSRAIRAMEKAEREVLPLVIADFTHLTSDEKWDMTVAAGLEVSCYDSILFNGKGSVQCLTEDQMASSLSDNQRRLLGMVPGGAMTDKA